MKASGKVNPEKKASFKKTSNFINNFTFQLFNKVYPSIFIIVNQNLMNSEPAKVEIFFYILFWAKQKIKPDHTTQCSQQSYMVGFFSIQILLAIRI